MLTHRGTRFQAIVLIVLSAMFLRGAAAPIGVITSRGSFQLDGSRVMGTGTAFDGAMLATPKFATEVRLQSGAVVRMLQGAEGRLGRDHMVVHSGPVQLDVHRGAFALRANGLRVVAGGASGRVQVDHRGDAVQVAALIGNARVYHPSGALVADVAPGRTLLFSGSPTTSNAATLAGCVFFVNGRAVLRDATTLLEVELRGANPKPGARVQVTGTLENGILQATSTKPLPGGCSPTFTKAGAPPRPAVSNSLTGDEATLLLGLLVMATIASTGFVVAADEETVSR